TMPVRRGGGDDGGFGLTVVTALADLSFHPQPDGKIVRAVLPVVAPGTRKPFLIGGPYIGDLADIGEQTPASPLIDSRGGKTYVDLIEIDALRLRCVIGCWAEERGNAQT
ncbi:MAG: hypothetical protein JWN00_384, partial [Actinomycetia bacterium]|nr:hypothetical protein [Actinomycetes bacterium]